VYFLHGRVREERDGMDPEGFFSGKDRLSRECVEDVRVKGKLLRCSAHCDLLLVEVREPVHCVREPGARKLLVHRDLVEHLLRAVLLGAQIVFKARVCVGVHGWHSDAEQRDVVWPERVVPRGVVRRRKRARRVRVGRGECDERGLVRGVLVAQCRRHDHVFVEARDGVVLLEVFKGFQDGLAKGFGHAEVFGLRDTGRVAQHVAALGDCRDALGRQFFGERA